jgi:hypothetical protein
LRNAPGALPTIERDLGANATDTFSVVNAGFTVSGNALQSGGQTFATFSSTGGIFTVSFVCGGAVPRKTLVNDVSNFGFDAVTGGPVAAWRPLGSSPTAYFVVG